MIDHDAAVRFDTALDRFVRGNPTMEEPLLETARAMQQLDATTRAVPSDAFRAQLRGMLAGEGSVDQHNGHHPVAVTALPVPLPRRPAETRASHRWLAIAAALLLLLTGGGAIVLEGIGLRDDSEPSAIPAAMLGTVEASPVTASKAWTVVPPQGIEHSLGAPLIANGVIYGVYAGQRTSTYLQAVDIETGQLLWDADLTNSPDLSVATSEDLLLVVGTNGADFALVAYDGRTGDERWSITLAQRPVNLIVDGEQAYVLGSGNLLQAFDLGSLTQLWQSDLSEFDPDWTAFGGLNGRLYLNGGRLGVSNGMLGALTSNGRLVAVNAEDGSLQWANDRTNGGQTSLSVVDDRFVVTAVASWDGTVGHDPSSIPSTPVAGYDPKTQPCQRTIAPRTNANEGDLGEYGESIDSLDPETGDSPWGLRTHAAVWIFSANDSSLIAMIRPGWDSAIGNEDSNIYCLIDGATGAFQETSGAEFAVLAYTDPTTDRSVGIGVAEGGIPLWLTAIDPGIAATLPLLDVGINEFSGFRWVQKTEDMVLVTLQDGTLLGLPRHSQSSMATATPAEPANDGIAWSVDGSEGAVSQPAAANGRIFRVTGTGLGWNHLQAIDADDGSILWEWPVPIGVGVMQTYGDWLLVAGQDGESLGFDYLLVAYDVQTGEEAWRRSLSQLPAGMVIHGDQAYLLGNDNHLDAIDLSTRTSLYVSDLRGASLPLDAIPNHAFTTYNRLVFAGDNLVAVLADGSIAGIDAETGTAQWWRLSDVPRMAQIYELTGHLVVAEGSAWESLQTSPVDSEATPVASPVPDSTACLDLFGSIEPDGTHAGLPESAWVQSFLSLDAETGDLLWSAGTRLDYRALPFANGFVMVANIPASDIAEKRSDMAVCAVNTENGTVSPIEDLRTLTDKTFRWSAAQGPLVTGLLADGNYLTFPHDLAPEWFGPEVDLQIDPAHPGIGRADTIDGAIYLSLWDGRLIKLEEG